MRVILSSARLRSAWATWAWPSSVKCGSTIPGSRRVAVKCRLNSLCPWRSRIMMGPIQASSPAGNPGAARQLFVYGAATGICGQEESGRTVFEWQTPLFQPAGGPDDRRAWKRDPRPTSRPCRCGAARMAGLRPNPGAGFSRLVADADAMTRNSPSGRARGWGKLYDNPTLFRFADWISVATIAQSAVGLARLLLTTTDRYVSTAARRSRRCAPGSGCLTKEPLYGPAPDQHIATTYTEKRHDPRSRVGG